VTFHVTGTLTAPAYVLATYGSISGTATFSSATPPTGYTINYSYNSGTQIALVAIPTDPFKNWIDTFGLTSGQKGKASDPDNDGLDNLGEFALDGNPNSGANNGKVVTQEATVGTDKVLTLTLPVRTGATFTNVGGALQSAAVDGVVYTIQGSGDLSDWSLHVTEITPALSTGLPALSVIPGDTGSWTYRTFRSPGVIGTDAKQFLRVKTEQAP